MEWIFYLIPSICIFIFAVSCWFVVKHINKEKHFFEENKKKAVAEVVGHERISKPLFSDEGGTWDLLVKFVDNDEISSDFTYLCATDGVSYEQYPNGSKINVWYAKKGKLFVQVSMEDSTSEGKGGNLTVENVFKWLGIFSLTGSIILLVLAVLKM